MVVSKSVRMSAQKSLRYLVLSALSVGLIAPIGALAQAPLPIAPSTSAAPATPLTPANTVSPNNQANPAAPAPSPSAAASPTGTSAPPTPATPASTTVGLPTAAPTVINEQSSAPAAKPSLIKPNTNAYNGSSASTNLLPNANPARKSNQPPDPFKVVTITENNPVYTVEVKYPQFDSIKGNDPGKLNEEIKRYVMAQIDAARAVMPVKMNHVEGPKPLSYIKGSCLVSAYHPDLCSMTVDLSNYAFQSAHPVEALSTFNYRIDTNQQFGLKDLFRPNFKYIPTLSKVCIATLSEGLDDDGVEWVKRGAAPEDKNFGKFQIKDGNLDVIFDPYTVDNGADGFKHVAINWDRIRANVALDPPFHKLVSH